MADPIMVKYGSKEQRDFVRTMETSVLGAPSFTIGTEAANVILVTIQLKDASSTAIATPTAVHVYLSSTSGGVPSGTAPNAATSFTTGTLLKELTTKVYWHVVCNSSGQLVLSISDSGTPTFYVNVVGADGKVTTSSAVTFA